MKMQSLRNSVDRICNAITRTRHTHTSESHSIDIDHGEAMEILSSDRRRWALEYLADKPANSTVTVSDLAEFVAAKENDCNIEEIDSKQRERVYIAFLQSHAVKMHEIIEYDEDRKTITPTETPARLWTAYCAFCETLDD